MPGLPAKLTSALARMQFCSAMSCLDSPSTMKVEQPPAPPTESPSLDFADRALFPRRLVGAAAGDEDEDREAATCQHGARALPAPCRYFGRETVDDFSSLTWGVAHVAVCAGSCATRPPVIRRAPRLEGQVRPGPLDETRTRLRKPMRNRMWMNSHASHADEARELDVPASSATASCGRWSPASPCRGSGTGGRRSACRRAGRRSPARRAALLHRRRRHAGHGLPSSLDARRDRR